jgi:hypothetical protein
MNENQVIEYRIKTEANKNQKWEALRKNQTACADTDEAKRICQVLLDSVPTALEIRWNWVGSTQGHYVSNRLDQITDPIVIKAYNHEKKENEVVNTVSATSLARSITSEQLITLIYYWANNMAMSPERTGSAWGQALMKEHRTMQQTSIALFFQILYTIGNETEYTDARNEASIEACKKLVELVKKDEIRIRYPFI